MSAKDGIELNYFSKSGFDKKFEMLCNSFVGKYNREKEDAGFIKWVYENISLGENTNAIWWEFFALTMRDIMPPDFLIECRKESPDMSRLTEIGVDASRSYAMPDDYFFGEFIDTPPHLQGRLLHGLHLSRMFYGRKFPAYAHDTKEVERLKEAVLSIKSKTQ